MLAWPFVYEYDSILYYTAHNYVPITTVIELYIIIIIIVFFCRNCNIAIMIGGALTATLAYKQLTKDSDELTTIFNDRLAQAKVIFYNA